MQIYFNFIKYNQKEHLKALCVRFRIEQAKLPTISALYGTISIEVAANKRMSFEFTYKTSNIYAYTGNIPPTEAI